MNIFMQGMRRSGTTIIFDILSQDKGLDLYYEPFALAKVGDLGGGSGEQKKDLFSKIRAIRNELCSSDPSVKQFMLNYGAPTTPALEFERDMPEYCKKYLKLIVSKKTDTVCKFTRMYCKTNVLKEIDPDAKFIHIVRDPRAVALSYLFGKNQKNRKDYRFKFLFFQKKTELNNWKMRDFSEHILQQPEYSHLQKCPDYIRVLLTWKYVFDQTYSTATEQFGNNYFLLRHEDLVSNPKETIENVYRHLGRQMPEEVISWANERIKKTEILWGNDKRWIKAMKKIGMENSLTNAGYDNLIMP